MKTSGRLARRCAALGFAVVAAASLAAPLEAQGYFGQNQVQYDRLRWRVIETEHFLVHYYPEIADVAPDAARMAERSYARLSRLMAHQFGRRSPSWSSARLRFRAEQRLRDLGEGTRATDPLPGMAQFFTGDGAASSTAAARDGARLQCDLLARPAGSACRTGDGESAALVHGRPAEYFPSARSILDRRLGARRRGERHAAQHPQMTERRDKYFPYRVASRCAVRRPALGDERSARSERDPDSASIDRAFRREIGMTTDELSEEWKQRCRRSTCRDRHAGPPAQLSEPLLSHAPRQQRRQPVRRAGAVERRQADHVHRVRVAASRRGVPDLYLATPRRQAHHAPR